MKIIELTKNKAALVDDDDYEYINQYRWYAQSTKWGIWYAVRFKDKKAILMHREILHAPNNYLVDHIDHDGLNNQKSNIRLATSSENNRNKRMKQNKKSGYKGVSFHPDKTKSWRAEISVDGKRIHIGYYNTALEAALAYDARAIELFGEFALTNLGGI